MPQPSQASVWPEGRSCAISLTYDGVLGEHLALLPTLDDLGLRATFFASPTRLLDDISGWQKAAETHEIGNHSLYKVADGGTLLNWDLEMIQADVMSTNRFISQVIGQVCNSFALPGWSTHCAAGDYLPVIQRMFPFVRSDRREANRWGECDLGYVGSFPSELPDLNKQIEKARKEGSWVVIRAEAISDRARHVRLLKGLAAASETMWLAPFSEVAAHLAGVRANAL